MWLFLGSLFLLFVLALLTSVLIAWVVISHESFTDVELKSGEEYEVLGKTYRFPVFDKIEGKPMLLQPEVIGRLRTIFTRAHDLFKDLEIDYFVTGGTLLGAIRHNTIPMPFDDDVDLGVDISLREFMFSPLFTEKANEKGLQTKYLAHNNATWADRHGAAVRLQLLDGDFHETCDVFFYYHDKEQSKVFKNRFMAKRHVCVQHKRTV